MCVGSISARAGIAPPHTRLAWGVLTILAAEKAKTLQNYKEAEKVHSRLLLKLILKAVHS